MRIILITLTILLFVHPCNAADNKREHAFETCMASVSDYKGATKCNQDDLARWDRKLNDDYTKLMSVYAEHDRTKLKELQLAWIKFRDLNCSFDNDPVANGSEQDLFQTMCLLKMTQDRVSDLESYLTTVGK